MGTEKTHIEITTDTRRELRVWKAKRDLTYDEAILELISGYHRVSGVELEDELEMETEQELDTSDELEPELERDGE